MAPQPVRHSYHLLSCLLQASVISVAYARSTEYLELDEQQAKHCTAADLSRAYGHTGCSLARKLAFSAAAVAEKGRASRRQPHCT